MALTGHRTFVGFGFGAIQAGLFLYEAFRSGGFARLVVGEVAPDAVDAFAATPGATRSTLPTPIAWKRRGSVRCRLKIPLRPRIRASGGCGGRGGRNLHRRAQRPISIPGRNPAVFIASWRRDFARKPPPADRARWFTPPKITIMPRRFWKRRSLTKSPPMKKPRCASECAFSIPSLAR